MCWNVATTSWTIFNDISIRNHMLQMFTLKVSKGKWGQCFGHASSMTLGKETLVSQLFSLEQIVKSFEETFTVLWGGVIHDPLAIPLASTWHVWFRLKCLQSYWLECQPTHGPQRIATIGLKFSLIQWNIHKPRLLDGLAPHSEQTFMKWMEWMAGELWYGLLWHSSFLQEQYYWFCDRCLFFT